MSWQTDYLAALQARDRKEQASKAVVDAYTALADRTTNSLAPRSSTTATTITSAPADISTVTTNSRSKPKPHRTTSTPSTATHPPPSSTHPRTATPPTTTSSSPSSTLQTDLSTAQSARLALQERVRQLTIDRDQARTELAQESSRAGLLAAERGTLAQRLRDRDEELRGKAKLLDDVQNEAVTLEMQLNVTEERNRELKRENEELVDRWMKRMGDEAERMNLESRFS